MIYSEVETHRGTWRERRQVMKLLLATAREPDIPRDARIFCQREALRYLLPWARVSTYIVSHADEEAA